MEEDDLRASGNIEDRRGKGGVAKGGLGIGAILVLTLIGWATGIDPRLLIGGAEIISGSNAPPTLSAPGQQGVPADRTGIFVARILGETEDVWTQILPQQAHVQYEKPILVLYSGITHSGCGTAQSAMGPFYCPRDHRLYLDTSFFADMQQRLGGGGGFAYAYVIAHEVGHHVQNLTGLLSRVQQAEAHSDRTGANALSVKTELMADCLAGVWAYHMNERHHNINDADVRQAVSTAAAIGDNRLQRQSGRGAVVPDSFTHGLSAQRVQWLSTGLHSGDMRDCNTFAQLR
ncbi:MAG: KPN_02809 family neutral zinc metallopeptidase [Acetobacteraceae bacterium]